MNIGKKVTDSRISENHYRAIKDRLSYSSIKTFDTDRRKFYQEYVLGEPRREKETIATIMGSMVHLLLSLPQSFDEKFHIASAPEPTGQMLELCEALYSRALKSISDGVQKDKFETLFTDAVNSVKYDYNMKEVKFVGKNLEQIIALFTTTDKKGVTPEQWYKEKIECVGKQIVSVGNIETAEKIVQKIKEHPYTASIANMQESHDMEVYNEWPIMFMIDGVECKSMVDKLIIHHDKKEICTYDWKTSWDNENPEYAYVKFGYYIQAWMYCQAVMYWAKESGLGEYVIKPMEFIFCDTQGFSAPTILQLSMDDIERAGRGFRLRGKRYKGVDTLLQEIAWHISTGDWSTPYDVWKNNGYIQLRLDYGSRI